MEQVLFHAEVVPLCVLIGLFRPRTKLVVCETSLVVLRTIWNMSFLECWLVLFYKAFDRFQSTTEPRLLGYFDVTASLNCIYGVVSALKTTYCSTLLVWA